MINFIDLNDIIVKTEDLYAHVDCARVETLQEHLDNCKKLMKDLNKKYNIEKKLKNTFSKFVLIKKSKKVKLNDIELSLVVDMFFNSIILHDIGKINPKYQIEKLKNNKLSINRKINLIETHHAPISAILFINEFEKKLLNTSVTEKLFLRMLMLSFANIIYCHHGKLQNLEKHFSKHGFEDLINTYSFDEYLMFYNGDVIIDKALGCVPERIKSVGIEFDTKTIYTIIKLLNSLLISIDFITTYCFYKNISTNDFVFSKINNVDDLAAKLRNSPICGAIEKYKIDKGYFSNNNLPIINELRSKISIECTKNLSLYKDEFNIFNIEAPTGSGKTYNGIKCALNLLENKELKKILYISPSNVVSNQTSVELVKLLGKKVEVQEINSITPLPIRADSQNEVDYEKILLDKHLLNYEITLTSHVLLFDILFGTTREKSIGLFQMFDSVVILDEIQSYRNSIWREIIEMIYEFSEIMNIKIIIMSATLPNLQELMADIKNRPIVNLLKTPKEYYNNPIFKDRVKIDKSLLKEQVSYKILNNKMMELINTRHKFHNERGQIFLAEFIKKSTSREFYKMIKSELSPDEYKVYQIDGDDSVYIRNEILSMIKSYKGSKHIILISTQLIEVGIDIDADLGMKDATFPDLDEQFMGRINRSGSKKDCIVLFFNLDNERTVYKDDFRNGTNIKDDKYLECLENKEFRTILYPDVMKKIQYKKNGEYDSNIARFYNDELYYQRFDSIEKRMQLITDKTISVFIPIDSLSIKDIDEKEIYLSGKKVWDKFIEIVRVKEGGYAQSKVREINHRKYMNYFMYNIYGREVKELEPVGGIYYIEDGEVFLNEGKLDTDSLKNTYTVL